jgi:hypothetical protein
VFSALADGTACDDGDPCNGAELCITKVCVSPGLVGLDDGDSCTLDTCDSSTGVVTHSPLTNCVHWESMPTTGAPTARARHTATWTGSYMIVWGGGEGPQETSTATGGVYYPPNKSWSAIASAGAPSPRQDHRAVWTGNQLVVWGGYGTTSALSTGGIYNPATNTWKPMSDINAPSPRFRHSMVWTGSKVVVFGGFNNSAVGGGGIYDIATDTWTALPQGAPSPRYNVASYGGGGRAVFWGGGNLFDWLGDGKVLDSNLNWVTLSSAGAPSVREQATAIWASNEALFWGGWDGGNFENDGARLSFTSSPNGTWSPMSSVGAPSPRAEHVAVWTGSRMFIWGGCGGMACDTIRNDGAIYLPDANGGSWTPVPGSSLLSGRRNATAVWTGAEVIVWGGRSGSGALLGDGAHAGIQP